MTEIFHTTLSKRNGKDVVTQVAGSERIKAQLNLFGKNTLQRVAKAVEASAIIVSNHAKDNHVRGQAHAIQRYENQTNELTTSITPKLTVVTEDEVTAEVFTKTEYADYVETTHPYMFVALHESRDEFHRRVQEALR